MIRLHPGRAASAVLAIVALLAPCSRVAAVEGTLVEKTVVAPKEKREPVNLTFGKVTLLDVESRNDPNPADVKDAEQNDPKDRTFLLIRFRYRNDDWVKQRVRLRVYLMDGGDGVLAEGGRSGSLDAQTKDDTFSFPVSVRTVDWPQARRLRILATFLR